MWGRSFGALAPPNSQQVKTLQELQKPWTDSIDAFNQSAAQAAENPLQPSSGLRNSFNQMLADRFSTYQNLDYGNLEKVGDNYWNAAVNAARNGAGAGSQADQFFSGNGFNFTDLAQSEGAGSFDWAAYNKAMKDIADPFNEAQARQQQAYGQMQGGNYFGGMMDSRYSQAFGGQMQQGGNGDPTSASAFAVPGESSFSDTFNAKKKPPANQFKVGGWGSYNGWG